MKKSCIAYRERSRVAVLHEDLLEICDGNMLAAMLLSILIYWTDVKLAGYEQECEQAKATGEPVPIANLWIWKSHEGFQHDLMNDKDGMRKVHRTTIAAALKLLQDKQFIASRRNPRNNIDQTRQYRVDTQCVQSAIRALPSLIESIKTDNRMSEIMQSNVGNHAMDSIKTDNALHKNRQAIPEITTRDYLPEITDKDEDTYAQSATAIAPHTPAQKNEEREDGRDATARGTENAGRAGNRATGNALAGSHADTGDPALPLPEPKKTRTRKPKAKAEPVNAEQQARISAVFDTFDALARECYHDPDFSYDRSKAANEAITAFLALSPVPTVEKLKTHYRDLFKRPASKDGFLWRDNMSIAAVLRDYGRKPKAPAVTETTPTGYTIDEERNARNRARLAEEAAAIRAQRAANEQAQQLQKQQEVSYAVSR